MLDKGLLRELEEYVEKHSIKLNFPVCERVVLSCNFSKCKSVSNNEIEDFINNNQKSKFNEVLFSFIDKKGVSDSDVYKKAGIDRRHFSKIRSNCDYKPGKNTVIALAIALELDKKEMNELLSAAGFSLSSNDTLDLVIQFFLEKKMYDIDNINQALDYFSLKPLTGIW